MKKSRIEWIDIAKGFGILLVVAGHTMSPVMTGYPVMEKICQAIYMFHMPLFFLLAGLVCGKLLKAGRGERKSLLIGRAKRLLVPYATWAVIYIPIKLLMEDQVRFEQAPIWTVLLGNNPAGQLWFLYVLFLLSVITLFFVYRRSLPVWCVIGGIASILAPAIPVELGFPGIGLSFSTYQVGFFFMGLLLTEVRETCFRDGLLAVLFGIVWASCTLAVVLDLGMWYLEAIGAAGACYVICFCAGRLKTGKLTRFFGGLGRRSMEIYILHAPILVVCRILLKPFLAQLPWIYVLVVTVVSVTSSVLATELVIKKIKPLRFILFGG